MKRYLFLLRVARFGLMAVAGWCGLSASARPVVFLHGWNSDGEIWKPLQELLVSDAGYEKAAFKTYSYYELGKGFDTDTPIETLAAAVAERIAADVPEGEFDVVAHSMGGRRCRNPSLTNIIETWKKVGCPNGAADVGAGLTARAADFAYAVLCLKSRVNPRYGTIRLKELADAGDENARRFLKRK